MSSNCYSSWLWKEIANQTSSVKTVLTQISFSALGTACLGIMRSLKDFQTDTPIILNFLEMTPINFSYCESDPPPPLLIAEETTKNYEYSNYKSCSLQNRD